MDLTAINSAMSAAFAAALANPQKIAPAPVGDDPNQTVQTVVYTAPGGSGFRIVGTLNIGGCRISCTRNHGPDTASERAWPADIEAEVDRQITAAKVAKGGEIYRSGRAATLAIFEQLPLGVQAQFDPVLDASDIAAKSGDIAKAKQIVQTCVVQDALTPTHAALVAALDAVLIRATALAAATTIEEIKAL